MLLAVCPTWPLSLTNNPLQNAATQVCDKIIFKTVSENNIQEVSEYI